MLSQQIVFMELPVCGEEEGEKIGNVLTDFYNGMGTAEEAAAKEANAKETKAKMAALAAKKKQEEEEAEHRRKEEEKTAAAKKAEQEFIAAAKEKKRVEEAAAAEARRRTSEEVESLAEANRADGEAAAAAQKQSKKEQQEEAESRGKEEDKAAAAKKAEQEFIVAANEKKIAEEAAAAEARKFCVIEEAEAAEAMRAKDEADAAAQKKIELEERLAALESLAKGKKAEDESTAAQERVDDKEAALAAKQRAKEEEMLTAAKAYEKAKDEAALASTKKKAQEEKELLHKLQAVIQMSTTDEQPQKVDELLHTNESNPAPGDTIVVHAPMSRELADIRRGELEKIKSARSNIHTSLRCHWEDRVKSNDQTHVSLVANARAKVEKGAVLTRYLELQEKELQEKAKMRGAAEENKVLHKKSHEQDREVEPQGQSPTNTNYKKRNSRETVHQFEQQIKLRDQTHVIASTYDEKFRASNHFDAIDKHDQQQPSGFEDDWQSAEDAVKERMGSFRANTDTRMLPNTSQRTLTGETNNEASKGPDVSIYYGDKTSVHAVKELVAASDANTKGRTPTPPEAPPKAATGESNESPVVPDVTMYGETANAEGTFNTHQERGDGFFPVLGQKSKQEASTIVETPEVDDSEMGERRKEEIDVIRFVQTPVIGSAEDAVGEVSDGNSDKIPDDQLPIIKYGEAPEIYEGDETSGENRAQKWHEQAAEKGEAVDIARLQAGPEEENGQEKEGNTSKEDVGEDTTQPVAANNTEEEDAEAAKKRAEEKAAAAAKNAEEKAARKEARKAIKRAKRAEERAAAKKAEQEAAAAAAAATQATPSTDELSNLPLPDSKGGCGCIIC